MSRLQIPPPKMKNKSQGGVGIHIGANRKTVKEARGAINDILRAPAAEQKTKREALKALSSVCAVTNTSISNCSITGPM